MELSVRHAAEFFAFYVCRFVLADVGVLLDKFIKRGTSLLGPIYLSMVSCGERHHPASQQPFQPRLACYGYS